MRIMTGTHSVDVVLLHELDIANHGSQFHCMTTIRIVFVTAFDDYAAEVARKLKDKGIRAEADLGSDRMNAKIRNAQMEKIPYMLVVGDREMNSEQVAVRARGGVDLGVMGIEQFAQHLATDVARHGRETVEN